MYSCYPNLKSYLFPRSSAVRSCFLLRSMSTAQNIQSAGLAKVTIRAADTAVELLPWDEFWQHRELLYFLTWRDIKIRYKQTALGITWAILQPLAVALALTAFLGRVFHMTSDDLPYPVFAYAGMVLWQLFAQSLAATSNSIVRDVQLISKVYFPRLLVPLSAILASLLDFAVSLLVLIVFLVYFRIAPTAAVVLFPLFVLPAILSSLGAGLWLSALNVKYRDVHYTVNFFVQFWFFATPVVYPVSSIPVRWRLLYELNPMVGALRGISLGFARQWNFSRAVVHARHFHEHDVAGDRPLLLPQNRGHLCGLHLTVAAHSRFVAKASASAIGSACDPRYRTLRERHLRPGTSPRFARCGGVGASSANDERDLWALRDLSLEVRRWRGAGRHWAKRVRQIDAAEDPVAHHKTNGRASGDSRPGRQPA